MVRYFALTFLGILLSTQTVFADVSTVAISPWDNSKDGCEGEANDLVKQLKSQLKLDYDAKCMGYKDNYFILLSTSGPRLPEERFYKVRIDTYNNYENVPVNQTIKIIQLVDNVPVFVTKTVTMSVPVLTQHSFLMAKCVDDPKKIYADYLAGQPQRFNRRQSAVHADPSEREVPKIQSR